MSEIARIDEPEIDERVERLVWRGLGIRSARQIAEEAGISPETVLKVKKQLLDGIDVLSIQERRAKLTADLQDIAQRAQDDYDSSPWEFKAGILNAATSAIDKVLKELARIEKQDTSKVEALNELRVRELLRLMTAVVESGVREVSEEFGLDENRVMDIFNARLVIEAQETSL